MDGPGVKPSEDGTGEITSGDSKAPIVDVSRKTKEVAISDTDVPNIAISSEVDSGRDI